MAKLIGLGRRLPRENILRMYQKGKFQTTISPTKLFDLYGDKKEALSLESLQKIEEIMELLRDTDCAACGAPDCRTFAEDIVRGGASLQDCLWISAHSTHKSKREKGNSTMKVNDLVQRFDLKVVAGDKFLDELSELFAPAGNLGMPRGLVEFAESGRQRSVRNARSVVVDTSSVQPNNGDPNPIPASKSDIYRESARLLFWWPRKSMR